MEGRRDVGCAGNAPVPDLRAPFPAVWLWSSDSLTDTLNVCSPEPAAISFQVALATAWLDGDEDNPVGDDRLSELFDGGEMVEGSVFDGKVNGDSGGVVSGGAVDDFATGVGGDGVGFSDLRLGGVVPLGDVAFWKAGEGSNGRRPRPPRTFSSAFA